ncbi:MAG: glycosyltransferase family 39 protein [Gammaproteobacteria bacterium]
MLFLFLVTGLVLAGWWLLLAPTPSSSTGRAGRLVYTGLLSAAQIVGTEILLGATGLFRLPLLAGSVLAVSLAAVAAGWRRRRQLPAVAPAAGGDGALDPVNLVLLALLLAVAAWMAVATWLLPPRGVDDIVYHLPPLYDLVQTGRINILPTQIRVQFLLPLGGDFLYLWLLAFTHADTWVDGVQFVVALFGIGVVAALARSLGASRRDALFAGLLWLFVPVVLAQSASNYVEIILAVTQLVLLYAAVRFWQTGGWLHLAMAGLAAGFGLGVKYSMLVSIAGALPILLAALWRDGGLTRALRGAGLFALAAAPLPAFWLGRNWLVTGYPLFPYGLGATGLTDVGGNPASALPGFVPEPAAGSALGALLDTPVRFVLYLFEDPGLGSLNGGFGLVFWGCALPALAWCAWRAVARRDWLAVLLWAQVLLVVFTFLVQTDVSRVRFNLRLILVVVGLGLVALSLLLRELREAAPWTVPALRVAGVAVSLLAVVQLGANTLPTMQVRDALTGRGNGLATSPFIHYRQSGPDMAQLAPAFAAVDYLTQDAGGWQVSLAAEWRVFNTTPLFGSRLQNGVWNFAAEPAGPADALIFQQAAFGQQLFYPWPDRRVTPDDVRRDARYVRVPLPATAELWVLRSRLAEPGMDARLKEFSRRVAAGPAVQGASP